MLDTAKRNRRTAILSPPTGRHADRPGALRVTAWYPHGRIPTGRRPRHRASLRERAGRRSLR